MGVSISPSILAGNFANLEKEVRKVEKSGADEIHFDVMDGIFVPNITFGIKFIKDLRPITNLPFDVHLMIIDPERYIDEFIKAGSDIITFHIEATKAPFRLVCQIKERGRKVGISLNPATPIESILYLLSYIDRVLIMSVEPGFYGQKFIQTSLDKIKKIKGIIEGLKLNTKIEVDGGVNKENFKEIIDAGADILVTGSSFFFSENPSEYVKIIKSYK